MKLKKHTNIYKILGCYTSRQ